MIDNPIYSFFHGLDQTSQNAYYHKASPQEGEATLLKGMVRTGRAPRCCARVLKGFLGGSVCIGILNSTYSSSSTSSSLLPSVISFPVDEIQLK